jgi:hypothetical protein
LALSTLESVIKSTDSPTEKRRAASTLLRALDGFWNRPRERSAHHAAGRSNPRRSYAPPPPPLSRPQANDDPHTELKLLKEAFQAPQAQVALSTLHAHAAPNAFFAAHPVHPDPAEWVANTPNTLPAGFRFPLFLHECKETERTEVHSRWTCWATNTSKESFFCSFTLLKNPNTDPGSQTNTPDPCWRLATFDIKRRSG